MHDQFWKWTVDDLVKHLIQFACEILQNEQLRMQKGMKEDGQLLIWELWGMWQYKTSVRLSETLIKCFPAYMYGEALFRNPLNDLTQCLNWWKSLANDSGARILMVCLNFICCWLWLWLPTLDWSYHTFFSLSFWDLRWMHHVQDVGF